MHVFLDDSGDAGVKFGRGSTQHLVMAACVFARAEDMETATETLRRCREENGRGERWEFKHTKTSNDIKDSFFQAIRPLNFHIRAIVIDKKTLYSDHLRAAPQHLQNYAIKQLLTHTLKTIQDAKLVIDGRDSKAFRMENATYFRNEINREVPGTIRKVAGEDSHRNMLIQLADMVAGAIHRHHRDDRPGNSEHMQVILRKTKYPKGSLWLFK